MGLALLGGYSSSGLLVDSSADPSESAFLLDVHPPLSILNIWLRVGYEYQWVL
jgi:hypothetical protein